MDQIFEYVLRLCGSLYLLIVCVAVHTLMRHLSMLVLHLTGILCVSKEVPLRNIRYCANASFGFLKIVVQVYYLLCNQFQRYGLHGLRTTVFIFFCY